MFRWELPGKPIAIHLSLDLVDRLERETIEAFKAVTKRGSEIGGILLGRSASAGRRIVLVEDFEHVECDYARGPLYMLAEEDGARFEQVLARARARTGGLSVVGFFRSNTRRDLALDDEDATVLDANFPDPAHVCLLVKPFAMKPSTAALFFREDGRFAVREPYETFAFRRAELEKTFPNLIVKPDDPSLAVFNARPEAARPAVKPPEKPAPPPPPRREERPQVSVAPPKESAPPPKAAPPPPPKKEEKPAAAAPLPFRREERPSIAPTKPEQRPAGPMLVKKDEAPAPPPVEEKPAPPAPKRDERPAPPSVTVRGAAPAPPAPAKEPVKEEPKPAAAAKVEPPPAPPAKPQEKPAPAVPAAEVAAPATPGLLANRWLWVALIVLLLGGAAVYKFVFMPKPVEQAQTDPLSLKVDRSAGQLLLSWNRNASAIQTASRAVLTISDGDHREDVDLDLGTLRNGNISYSPMTNDVGFRLEVTDVKGGKSVSESMRVLAGRPSPAVPMQQQAPLVAQKLTPVTASAPETQSAKQQPEPAAPAPAERTQEPTVTATTAVTAQPPKPESLAARLSAPAPQQLLDMPSIQPQGSAPVAPAALPSALTQVPLPAPAEPRPAQTAARPAQTPASRPAQTTASQPAAGGAQPRVGGVVEPATLIRRGPTNYPPLARQARISGTVRVEAVIGTDGKVKSAKAVSGPPLLRQAAVESVMGWTYRPATLNGVPSETTTQVDLLFSPGGR
jgi:TonB family protein